MNQEGGPFNAIPNFYYPRITRLLNLPIGAVILQCGKWCIRQVNPIQFAAGRKMRLAFFILPQQLPRGMAARKLRCVLAEQMGACHDIHR